MRDNLGNCNKQNVIQRYNYCVQDYERIVQKKEDLERNDIYHQLLIISWLLEIYKYIKQCNDSYTDNFAKYINALRSQTFAHPISTNRHSQYEFDGTFICVDIIPKFELELLFVSTSKEMQSRCRNVFIEGYCEYDSERNYDFAIVGYDERDNYKLNIII